MVPKCQLLESENLLAIPVCVLSRSSFDTSACVNVVSSSSDHVLCFFEHFALFFADFFSISAMLKLPKNLLLLLVPFPCSKKNQPVAHMM